MPILTNIAVDLGMSERTIRSIADRASSLYTPQVIGNGRIISVPRPELQLIQTWMADFIRTNTEPTPPFVTAYETGCSIVANARLHAAHRHLLTADIEHFFPSCSKEMVRPLFAAMVARTDERGQRRRLTEEDADLLTALACRNGRLPVGSPASPFIANRIMVPIDREIIAALPEGYAYSRYSDDISISADERIDRVAATKLVDDVLARHGFALNRKKLHCGGTGSARRVTGIYLTQDGSLSIGRERKNELRRQLYLLLSRREGYAARILGLLYFCKQVEPDYFNTLLAKYATCGLAQDAGGVIPALRSLMESR